MEIFKLFGSIFIDNEKANKAIDETDGKAKKSEKSFGSMVGTAAKWGAGIAAGAAVAGGAMLALTGPLTKSAASAQALNSQFEQVFKDMQGDAQAAVDGLANDFGMLPNRIKPSYTQATSMFKGLGLETEEAMKAAEDAVTLAADAAAFYDKSYEDANSALNSFIKGNYEGGESIGLFANETQMAAYASNELGLEWKSLDEAGKQLARMEYAKAMQEAAGATGQASRESDSLENKLGNLKQAWEDIKAKLGSAFLEPAINGLTKLTDVLLSIDTEKIVNGITKFKSYVTDVFIPAVTEIIDWVKKWKSDNEGTINALKESFGAFFDAIYGFIEAFVTWAKEFWVKYGDEITAVLSAVWDIIVTIIDVAIKLITDIFNIFAALFKGDWGALWEGIKNLFNDIWDGIGRILDKYLEYIKSAIKLFGKILKDIWNGIWDAVKQKFSDIWEGMINKLDGFVQKIKDKINNLVDRIKTKVNDAINLLNKIPGVDIGTIEISSNTSSIPGYADGTNYARGGLSLVGERGPELVNLSRGSQVIPNDELSLGGKTEVVFGRGAFEGAIITDDYGVDRLMDRIMERMNLMGVRA